MVEYKDDILDDVFGALADPTRRSILEQLRAGSATVSDLAAPHDITIQGISKHVRKLEAAGLVRRTKEGREVWCELDVARMAHASSWIDEQRRFWEARLDRLDALLKNTQRKNKEKKDGNKDD